MSEETVPRGGHNFPVGNGRAFQVGSYDMGDRKHGVQMPFDSEASSDTTTPPNESIDESAPSSGAAGTAPDEVYAKVLAPWRAAIRRSVMWILHNESAILAKMQARIRTPFWDKYFVYTSSLGTHTFFMVALPMLFFFGFAGTARG